VASKCPGTGELRRTCRSTEHDQVLEPIDSPTQISSRLNALEPQAISNLGAAKAIVVPIAEVERHASFHVVAEVNGDKLLTKRMLGTG